ncbi:MAG: XkdF-like putative serine protease domain-containing protein [bacterium]|nr:XkdF-like putative serine protease domain-containing protein [bacterium]
MNEILEKLESEIKKRAISNDEVSQILLSIPEMTNRRIIFGYASVSIIDRENQKISIPALKEAVKRFMAESDFRLVNIFHSDVSLGRILPQWTNPRTGKIYKTEVDHIGWKVVAEIRDDIELADKVWAEIQKGNIRSFSIAGTSKKKHMSHEQGKVFDEIDEMDLFEATLCTVPVCSAAIFEMLWDPNKVTI